MITFDLVNILSHVSSNEFFVIIVININKKGWPRTKGSFPPYHNERVLISWS